MKAGKPITLEVRCRGVVEGSTLVLCCAIEGRQDLDVEFENHGQSGEFLLWRGVRERWSQQHIKISQLPLSHAAAFALQTLDTQSIFLSRNKDCTPDWEDRQAMA